MYQSPTSHFGETRNYPWPGWEKIVEYISPGDNVLDLGCGNGRFGGFIKEKGVGIQYTGIDYSPVLLKEARRRLSEEAQLINADFTHRDWSQNLNGIFDVIVCFSVLHHIPGFKQRLQIISDCRNHLSPEGFIIMTTWQLQHFPRFKEKQVAPNSLGIKPHSLEENDYFISWGESEDVRFVHLITADELQHFTNVLDLSVTDRFYSDGKGGKQNLYSVLKKKTH